MPIPHRIQVLFRRNDDGGGRCEYAGAELPDGETAQNFLRRQAAILQYRAALLDRDAEYLGEVQRSRVNE